MISKPKYEAPPLSHSAVREPSAPRTFHDPFFVTTSRTESPSSFVSLISAPSKPEVNVIPVLNDSLPFEVTLISLIRAEESSARTSFIIPAS